MSDRPGVGFRRGDSVGVPLGPHDKDHPAIVLLTLADSVLLVIAGTGTQRELANVRVDANSRSARALNLYKTTYFYAANIREYPVELVRTRAGRCTPELLQELEVFAAPYLARYAAGLRTSKKNK